MKTIGKDVVHRRESRRSDIAQPRKLQRGRLAGKDEQAIGRVPGQIEEDVDLVAANLLGQVGVKNAARRSPLIGRGTNPRGQFILL